MHNSDPDKNDPASNLTISVVINNFNYGEFLAEAMQSALDQLEHTDELIVIDDGSRDNSLEVMNRFTDDPRVIVEQKQNDGQMNAVRRGVELASKDILMTLDSDDRYLPGYIHRVRNKFAQDPDLNFYFSKPILTGPQSAEKLETQRAIDCTEFPTGYIGPTKWATLEFFEFPGNPTSGLAFSTQLAKEIMQLPLAVGGAIKINPIAQQFFRIPEKEGKKMRCSADGIMVRTASALDARKFYDDTPGWEYRIHGSNKYAALPRISRWYARSYRKRFIIQHIKQTFSMNQHPTASELRREIDSRKWPLRKRRRNKLHLYYALAALRSKGSLISKLATAKYALTHHD
ncbi:MAG: glycosyltransferase family 2 protein [bacterium]